MREKRINIFKLGIYVYQVSERDLEKIQSLT